MKNYIAIDMQKMKENGLSVHEWILLECILFSSNNEFSSCFLSKKKLSEHISISERKIYTLISKLIDEEWIKKLSNGYLKCTQKWIDLQMNVPMQNLQNDTAKFADSTIKYEVGRGNPTEKQVMDMAKKLKISEETATKFYLYYEGIGWRRVNDFVPLLRKWDLENKSRSSHKQQNENTNYPEKLGYIV